MLPWQVPWVCGASVEGGHIVIPSVLSRRRSRVAISVGASRGLRSSFDAPSPTLSKIECLGKGRGCCSWTRSHILRGNLTKGRVLGLEIVLRGIRRGR